MKHCLLVNSAFILPFCVPLAFVSVQLDTGLDIFSVTFGKKVCNYLGGGKGGFATICVVIRGERGQTVTKCDKEEGVKNLF